MSTKVAALGWQGLEALASRHGPSFYLADLGHFEATYRRFLDAFAALYPRTSIGYSYKTNYLPAFIRRGHALGAYSEVVSRFEFDLARRLGIPGERIIYNGPVKRHDDLREAFKVDAIVNVDSVAELHEVLDSADGAAVGIRCYLGEHETPGSRFGIDLRRPEALDALAAVDEDPGVRLAGLHLHYCGDRSAEGYRSRTRAMISLHSEALGGRPLDYIDIGGGFASSMSPALAAQLPAPPASFEDYAEAVAGEMREAYPQNGPELIVEPGMALLADTMAFVTRVESVKRLGVRRLAVVDGSVFNIKPLRGSVNLPIRVVSSGGAGSPDAGPWDVVGHTCMEVDLLHTGHEGPVAPGDYVVVENVGAYTNVLNAPFIRPTPPIVELGDGGPGEVLRPESSLDDLLRSYGAET